MTHNPSSEGPNLEAARSGDRLRALEVLRDTLAAKLDTTQSETHAQLSAQYRATLAEIEEMSAGEGGSAADDAARRVLRLAGS